MFLQCPYSVPGQKTGFCPQWLKRPHVSFRLDPPETLSAAYTSPGFVVVTLTQATFSGLLSHPVFITHLVSTIRTDNPLMSAEPRQHYFHIRSLTHADSQRRSFCPFRGPFSRLLLCRLPDQVTQFHTYVRQTPITLRSHVNLQRF